MKKVLITGASSGIGESIAKEYASKGYSLILVARRKDRLETLKNVCLDLGALKAEYWCIDLSNQVDIKKLYENINLLDKLDVVIANAGIGDLRSFENMSFEEYKKVMDVNVDGVYHTVKASLEKLKTSKGRVGIVGSIQSFMVMPGSSAYCISKYAVRALSETLYLEFKRSNISVTFIAPGFIATEIRQKKLDELETNQKDPIPAFLLMPSKVAAKKIVKAVDKRKRQITLTYLGKFAEFLFTRCPSLAYFIVSRIKA